MYPDDVVSAKHFDGLCVGLRQRGWDVEARPSRRGCRDETKLYPRRDNWRQVRYKRVWRPRLRQSSAIGRLVNTAWMLAAWSRIALSPRRPDVVVVGTDPMFAVLVALPLKLLRPGLKIAHWCFDLHPECTVAEGLLPENSLAVRTARGILKRAYRCCDLLVDIGPCMRERLRRYAHGRPEATLVPWALEEPEEPLPPGPSAVRTEMFGDARLALLYSGNFGRAHAHASLLELARAVRGEGVHLCFAIRGNSADKVKAAVRPDDTNISFAGFAPSSELAARLGSADIHVASLEESWSGMVVPSKFFGGLASARPVLFAGPTDSALARWIQEHRVGWVLNEGSLPRIADELRTLARDATPLKTMRDRALALYRGRFSYEQTLDGWDRSLRGLLD